MYKQTIEHLFKIINGNNFFQLVPPDGGWTNQQMNNIVDCKCGKGLFFVREDGGLDYICQHLFHKNIVHPHPSLIQAAISQLKETCSKILDFRTRKYQMPYLHYLLIKYYGI